MSTAEGNHFQFAKNEALEQIILLEASMQDFTYGKHAHEEYSFGVTLAGRQDFFANGVYNKSHPGTVIALNPEEVHDGHSGGDAPLHYRMIYIHPEQLQPILKTLGVHQGVDFRFKDTLHENVEFRNYILYLYNLINDSNTPEILYSSSLLAFTEFLVRFNGLEAQQVNKKYSKSLLRALDYLQAHEKGDINLDVLSQQACMSKYHFLRTFRACFGMTPHQYWLNCRINKARQALTLGMSLDEVVYNFGFNDLSHFNRRFKPVFGMTPYQYQQHMRIR